MVNYQIHGTKRINFINVSFESCHRVSHSCEVNNCWHTSEVLEDDSGWLERDFNLERSIFFPIEDFFDILGEDIELVAVSETGLEEDSNGEGESVDSGVVEFWEGEVLVLFVVDS